jgi:hypothetical protein
MNSASPPAWRATGLIWTSDRALLEWSAPDGRTAKSSPLPVGADLAIAARADRRCVGIWRDGRRHACPVAAPLDPAARSGQCTACQATQRSRSIAADTRLDDPRPFAVYLAHHGDGQIKVGITAVERGTARLLEQGALASTWLSTGTLASARRAENLLGAALGLPDRVTAKRKRAARTHPGTAGERAADLQTAAERTRDLPWPEGQHRTEPQVTDHASVYGLPPAGLRPVAEVLPLAPGRTLAGTVECRIGTDLYLDTAAGLVMLDARLLAGWALTRAADGAAITAALQELDRLEVEQDALF